MGSMIMILTDAVENKFKILDRILTYGRMIKFSHTVFALPFALSSVLLAWQHYPVSIEDLLWILAAMVGARSAAMGFNRIADAEFDAKNPRTAVREIPSGKLSLTAAKIFVLIFSGIFIFAAFMLGKLCFYLSFPVLGVLFSYSYTKRFTWLAHIYLGLAISLAPLGAWIAITKSFSPEILLLCFALMTYIAGFDILYACQDTDFDREQGLFSMPANFGIKKSLWIAKLIHTASFFFFLSIYFAFNMTDAYLMTAWIIGMLLVFEHWLVKPDDLTHVNIAFFHVNSIISLTLFAGVLADWVLRA